MINGQRVITVEEHYWDPELSARFLGVEGFRDPEVLRRLYDLGDLRIKEMDESGIDLQLISHGAPSTQKLPADIAPGIARSVNDRLFEAMKAHPTRFRGFAALPTPAPEAAADELERCVKDLNFVGAMIHGLTNEKFLDDKMFRPIFARAEALDVPIYLHPAVPHPAVMDAYYKDYMKDFPMVIRAAWGFTVETATMVIRLILSGIFEEHPNLKICIGHMGETLPFLLWRINQALSRPGNKSNSFRDIFCKHFWITTSGNFSNPALVCSMMELGIDRIIFAIDWPFVPNPPGMEWIQGTPICGEDRAKVLHGNAEKLFKL